VSLLCCLDSQSVSKAIGDGRGRGYERWQREKVRSTNDIPKVLTISLRQFIDVDRRGQRNASEATFAFEVDSHCESPKAGILRNTFGRFSRAIVRISTESVAIQWLTVRLVESR